MTTPTEPTTRCPACLLVAVAAVWRNLANPADDQPGPAPECPAATKVREPGLPRQPDTLANHDRVIAVQLPSRAYTD